ncbi:unnamed protein product [Cylicocyclus nassatus]|uniref:Uncharacterized protein n=1 Tax=Cylicocyclus nassatus TaxID=53992 RepID=A0AA36GNM4_CYLNA|nr:unnamed protein product [Cylicocyclus nassatus]
MVSLATVIFLLGAIFIHEVCGGPTTEQLFRRKWYDPDSNLTDPTLRFKPGSESVRKHHGLRKRSLWSRLWDLLSSLVGEPLTDQERSEKRKELERRLQMERRLHNISEYGQGHGHFGDGFFAGHHPHDYYYYEYYMDQGPNPDLR